jgi:hypothetical protein
MNGHGPFLNLLTAALESIREPRFFRTERGYQGELVGELRERLGEAGFPGDPVVEQEYQKRIRTHGIRIRPDIIIHIPFERGLAEFPDSGNFVAIELKWRATKTTARAALANLARIREALKYPLTVFINIDSEENYATSCLKRASGLTVCFAVRLEGGRPVVRSRACNGPRKKNHNGD